MKTQLNFHSREQVT